LILPDSFEFRHSDFVISPVAAFFFTFFPIAICESGQIPFGLKPPPQNHKSPISEHDLKVAAAVSDVALGCQYLSA
jgi:hypothetical protein